MRLCWRRERSTRDGAVSHLLRRQELGRSQRSVCEPGASLGVTPGRHRLLWLSSVLGWLFRIEVKLRPVVLEGRVNGSRDVLA